MKKYATKFNPSEWLYDDHGFPCKELRVLPLNGDSNILLGRQGYNKEISHRIYMNKSLSDSAKWKLPAWEDLKIYDSLLIPNFEK